MNKDFQIVRNAVSLELCEFLALEFTMMAEVCGLLYPGEDLSDMSKNTFARYSPLMFEALSVKLLPTVEQLTNLTLYPAYSYARIYYKNSELQKHIDRPSSEVTVSLCITKDETSWPLHIQDSEGVDNEIFLDVGDMVVYSGRKHLHWRTPFTGTSQIQAFFQYVNAFGNEAWLKWDSRPSLGLPAEWCIKQVRHELAQIAENEFLNKSKN
jgi:hypothetical protein